MSRGRTFTLPQKQDCELHEDLIACQWQPEFMTAFSGETSSTRLSSCCQLGTLVQLYAASYGHSPPTHPSLLCTFMSYKLIHALRLDAGAPTPRKPREQGAEKRCCTVHSPTLWRIKHDATKQKKGALPERERYLSVPLNKHLSSLKNYSTDLPHLFFPSSLGALS